MSVLPYDHVRARAELLAKWMLAFIMLILITGLFSYAYRMLSGLIAEITGLIQIILF